MQRLGVAALGMYNRRKVHILTNELNEDLAFFKLEREVAAQPGKALSQADLLLGSFFFVHKSKALHGRGSTNEHEEIAAFEFLHNTFGEFLTADFILQRALSQVEMLRAADSNHALKSLIDKTMSTADGFERDWFASLVYTPLFTRPVIMEMIREWAPHILKSNKLTEKNFVETLEKIVINQINRMLNMREMPQIMRKETAQEGYRVPFGDHPLIGHIAVYSINLILLRIITSKQPFLFDETDVASHEDGTRPWDRLTHIWRSWFSLGSLNGLTAVMRSRRSNSKVIVSAKKKFQVEESASRLQEFHNVALSMGDYVLSGISGCYLFDPMLDDLSELTGMVSRLGSEGFDIGLSVKITQLVAMSIRFPSSTDSFCQHGRDALEHSLQSGRRDQIQSVSLIIARTLEEAGAYNSWIFKPDAPFRDLLDPKLIARVAVQDPTSGRMLLSLGKNMGGFKWFNNFSSCLIDLLINKMQQEEIIVDRKNILLEWLRLLRHIGSGALFFSIRNNDHQIDNIFERFLHQRRLMDMVDHNPEVALASLQLIRKMGGRRYVEQFVDSLWGEEFFRRLLNSRRLISMINDNLEEALAYLQILKEMGGGMYVERFVESGLWEEIVERLLDQPRLMDMVDHNPERALAYLQLIRETGGGRYVERFIESGRGKKLLECLLHPKLLMDMIDHNPEGALAYLQLIREMGGGWYVERLVESGKVRNLFERVLHPYLLVDMIDHNPEGAWNYLQIIREMNGGRYIERFVESDRGKDLFERVLHLGRLLELGDNSMLSLSLVLSITRLSQSPSLINEISIIISNAIKTRIAFKQGLSTLRILPFTDLRWISEKSGNAHLQSVLAEFEPH